MRLYDPELMWAALGRILSVYMLGAAPGGSRARWERRARVLLLEGREMTVKRYGRSGEPEPLKTVVASAH